MIGKVREVFEKTNRTYGCRRLRKALSEEGISLSDEEVQAGKEGLQAETETPGEEKA